MMNFFGTLESTVAFRSMHTYDIHCVILPENYLFSKVWTDGTVIIHATVSVWFLLTRFLGNSK